MRTYEDDAQRLHSYVEFDVSIIGPTHDHVTSGF